MFAKQLTAAILACVLLGGMAWGARGADLPPAFSDLSLDGAKKQVDGTDKLVLVKFTAEWCGPCKAMDKTTWQDESVVKWVKDHGVAIQVDVDKEPQVAGNFKIAAMPTMVMLKGGNEIARKVGYMDGGKTLKWMEDASSGKLDGGPKADKNSVNIQERLQTARELTDAGKADEATAEYAWLWQNALKYEPAMVGVRSSFMASDMKQIAARHEPAKQAFSKLRDEAEEKLKSDDRDFRTLDDWIVLNVVVGDQARTLAWFDRIKGEEGSARTMERESFRLREILVDAGRMSEIPLIYPDPLRALKEQYAASERIAAFNSQGGFPADLDEATKTELKEQPWEMFREQAAILYVGFLAAGKDEKAAEIMAEARRLRETPKVITGVVGYAIRQGQARPVMAALLDDAAKQGADVTELRAKLEAALAEKK